MLIIELETRDRLKESVLRWCENMKESFGESRDPMHLTGQWLL